jgi:hypothetical protein
MITIIDPLKQKIRQCLIDGESNILSKATEGYPSDFEVEDLFNQYCEFSKNVGSKRYIYIDLFPFERYGDFFGLVNKISTNNTIRPIFLVRDMISRDFTEVAAGKPATFVFLNEMGNVINIKDGEGDQGIITNIEKDMLIKSDVNKTDLYSFRKVITEQRLTKIICKSDFLDVPTLNDAFNTRKYISGRLFRIMDNGMLVSCYIDMKRLGEDIDSMFDISYEALLAITECFRRDINLLNNFDYFVTANNTAVFLASLLEFIIDKPIVSIDKLGPIPSFQLDSPSIFDDLADKRVIVFQDVVATGNETDRMILFLKHMKAKIESIITLFNLEVGKINLANSVEVKSLCKPKDELKYVYRSD